MAHLKARMHKRMILLRMVLFLAGCLILWSGSGRAAVGTIKGRVVDRDTQAPLVGTTVQITVISCGTATDTSGEFIFADIPVGSYVIEFSRLGYKSLARPDIIVKSKRTTFVSVGLKVGAIAGNDVIVTSKCFSSAELQSNSTVELSAEELRRAPGAFADVNRMAEALPGVTSISDNFNCMVIRGGNPLENGLTLDNIEVANLNHFPLQGSAQGAVSQLNTDFIQNVRYYTGGFPVRYADKLSSITDVSYREGNRDEFDGQVDLNFSGYGAAFEGPLPQHQGSWLFSTRYSTLDLLKKPLNLKIAPRYHDYQGKLAWDIGQSHHLTALGFFGRDLLSFTEEEAKKERLVFSYYGKTKFAEDLIGVNWLYVRPERGYSRTSLAYMLTGTDLDLDENNTDQDLPIYHAAERGINLRNINVIQLGRAFLLETGVEGKLINAKFDNLYFDDIDPLGNRTRGLQVRENITTMKLGAFLDAVLETTERLQVTFGLRSDYFSYNDNWHLAPRLSLTYELSRTMTLNAAGGLYHQTIPLLLLAQNEANRELNDPQAIHFIFGLNKLLTNNTRLRIEAYAKKYQNMPLDTDQPGLCIPDELVYRYWDIYLHRNLIDSGQAFARGVEFLLQSKLVDKLYGIVSAAYSRSSYRDGEGIWRDRVLDSRVSFSLLVGYKPSRSWECSLRWQYAGGKPYSPIDERLSRRRRTEIFDRTRINAERLPPYHSLYIRLDKRIHFSGSNLIMYASVWNAYNRENVLGYRWSNNSNSIVAIYQWRILPVIGLKYEF